MSNTYCLTVDGAGVGNIASGACAVPVPGGPIPMMYIQGPDATDKEAVPNCAVLDPTTGKQTFTFGQPCANNNGLTFYSYASPQNGETPLCFIPGTSGIQGTITTFVPNQSGSCVKNLNFKQQNVTCLDTGCGDHGTCSPTSKQCSCVDGWSGSQCETPPAGNAGCTPDTATSKTCGNMGSYGNCNATTSSQTGITGSGACACNQLTSNQLGSYCEQHCTVNDGTACGGPLRGLCVDNNYNYYTNPNAVRKRCICINGWTGVDCSTPPPGWKCTADTDCTNLTTQNPSDTLPTGTCDKSTGICTCDNLQGCDAVNSQGNAFTGAACQIPLPVQGSPCQKDENCTAPQTCVSGTCTCPGGGNSPDPSSGWFATILKGLSHMLTTADGLKQLSGILLAQNGLPLAIKWMTTKALQQGFIKSIEDRLAAGMTGKMLGQDAKLILENSVGKRLAAKVLAKMTAKEVMQCTVNSAAEKVAAVAFKEVFGFIGAIDSFVNLLNIIGMVLDANDVLGFNEESSQSQIDATILKFNGAINSNKTVLANGLYFPLKQSAETTFPFMLKTLDTNSRNQFAIDAGNYISHLTVNSNGAAIIPTFQTALQQQQAALQSEAQGSVLYTLAGNNLTVYQRLKQDWPIIVAGVLVAIGVLVGSAFGVKALVNKKKMASNK